MNKKVILLLSFSLLINCKYFVGDHCNNTQAVIGTFENIYDKNATNLLIIKKDGSFEQKFIKDDLIKTNFGTWTFFEESCNLKLKNLKLMHDIGFYEQELFSENGKYRLNKIVFVEDLPKEFDFYRVR